MGSKQEITFVSSFVVNKSEKITCCLSGILYVCWDAAWTKKVQEMFC